MAPGVGAQGADAETVVRAAKTSKGGPLRLIVPVSRGIANAPDPAQAATKIRDEINAALATPSETTLRLQPHQSQFVGCVLRSGALKFGRFTLKSGRTSPYFFNAGLVSNGSEVAALFDAYASTVVASKLKFDVVFGPAYKGIPLAAGVAACAEINHLHRPVAGSLTRRPGTLSSTPRRRREATRVNF